MSIPSARSGHDNDTQTPELPDYASKPYAQFLEEVLPDMVQYDPVSIGIVFILPDGSIGTNYFNCDCTDLVLMANAISKDELLSWMKVNRDIINDEWDGDEEGDILPDDDSQPGMPESDDPYGSDE